MNIKPLNAIIAIIAVSIVAFLGFWLDDKYIKSKIKQPECEHTYYEIYFHDAILGTEGLKDLVAIDAYTKCLMYSYRDIDVPPDGIINLLGNILDFEGCKVPFILYPFRYGSPKIPYLFKELNQ